MSNGRSTPTVLFADVAGGRSGDCASASAKRVVVSNIMESISAASVRIDDGTVRRLLEVRFEGQPGLKRLRRRPLLLLRGEQAGAGERCG
jgi:hypothetical protein